MKKESLSLIVLCALLPACATMLRGTEQEVSVITAPPEAQVEFSDGQQCVSPCTITTKRDQNLKVTLRKKGCRSQTATLTPKLAGAGVMIGGIMDYDNGAVYDLKPNPLEVTLNCGK